MCVCVREEEERSIGLSPVREKIGGDDRDFQRLLASRKLLSEKTKYLPDGGRRDFSSSDFTFAR